MEGMRTGEALVEKLPALAGAHLADPRFTARGGIVDGADFDTSLAKDRPAVPGDLAPDALDGDCGGQVEAKAGEGFGGDGITNPDPREVSAKLMAREGDPAKAEDLNVLAAAWIQFQTHGWFSRDDGDEQDSEDAPDIESDDTRGRAVRRAPDRAKVGGGGEGAPAWRKRRMRSLRDRRRRLWDASQVYGRGRRERDALRTWQGGKLKIGENGLLPLDPRKGVARTGSNDNWWIALSALHHLFVKEHNHICEQLAARHPDFDDAQLYRAARLCVCALIAKIHAEWRAATRPRKAAGGGSPPGWRKAFRARGTVGEKTDHEGVRHTWPEEFASVYRLHPFMLDYYSMRSHEDDHKLATKDLFEVSGKRVRSAINEVGMASAIYSMGTEPPGAPTLHNCPALLRALRRDGGGEALDMVAADISLDRQHGVPRYNDFRELAGLKRLATFAEITPNLTWQRELEDVYKDVDSVDLMAGMLAEPPPEGCSLSETALRLLDAMAPEEVGVPEAYTEWGGRHVEETGLADVLLRHHPELGRSLEGVDNAFQPWKRVG